MACRLKKEKKKKRELKQKAKVRAAQAAQSSGGGFVDNDGNDTMFSLTSLRGKGALSAVAEAKAMGAQELAAMEQDSEDEEMRQVSAGTGIGAARHVWQNSDCNNGGTALNSRWWS